MTNRTTIRVNLLRAHGSPTRYLYRSGCRCAACRAAASEHYAVYDSSHRDVRAAYRASHAEERAAYYAAKSEWIAERKAAYYAANREEAAARGAAYHAAHREQSRAKYNAYRSRKMRATGTHTAADVQAQYKRQHGRCYWCSKKVGSDYHVDHVVPLFLGGSNGPENIVVACPWCNESKGAKHPMDWAGRLL
jgi:5-methylcytosine-specific restriction endonuclease McrA